MDTTLRNGVSGMARLSGAALLLEDDFPFGWEADVESRSQATPHRVPLRSSRIRRPGQPAQCRAALHDASRRARQAARLHADRPPGEGPQPG